MDYRVIEVNARLSRSSALASKATGYPHCIRSPPNSGSATDFLTLRTPVTKVTSAFFEPALDYGGEDSTLGPGKFHGVKREIGSSMKSVGEVMAIGRTFEEAIQKGLRMIGQGMHGFVETKSSKSPISTNRCASLPTNEYSSYPRPCARVIRSTRYMSLQKSTDGFYTSCANIVATADELEGYNSPEELPEGLLRLARSRVQRFPDSPRNIQEQYHLQYKSIRRNKGIPARHPA